MKASKKRNETKRLRSRLGRATWRPEKWSRRLAKPKKGTWDARSIARKLGARALGRSGDMRQRRKWEAEKKMKNWQSEERKQRWEARRAAPKQGKENGKEEWEARKAKDQAWMWTPSTPSKVASGTTTLSLVIFARTVKPAIVRSTAAMDDFGRVGGEEIPEAKTAARK